MPQQYATSPTPVYQARPVPPRRLALENTGSWLFRSAERVLGVLVLLVLLGAALPMIGTGGAVGELTTGQAAAENTGIIQPIFRASYLYILLLVAVQPRRFLQAVARHKIIWALLAAAAFSAAWSVMPDESARRAFRLVLTCMFVVTLVLQRDLRGVLRIFAWAVAIAAVLSVVFAAALPTYGLSPAPHIGAWRGVFVHKNTLGSTMTVGALLFVLLARDAPRRKWVFWGMAGLCAVLVALSRSTTSVVVLATVLVLLPLFRTLRLHPSRAVPVLIWLVLLAGCAGVTLVASYETLLVMLGKDPTLTGRTDLWAAVMAEVQQRPWLGHGYKAFWAEGNMEAVLLHRNVGWASGNAHNGFLELALELGVLGLALLGGALLVTVQRAVRFVREDRSPLGLWPLALLSVLVMQNLSESGLLYYGDLTWLLFVATVATADFWRGRSEEAAAPPAPAPSP